MPETTPNPGDETPLVPTSEMAETAAAAPPPELTPAACAARLAELFPALFNPRAAPKPLKLRIQADIQQRAPGIFSKKVLSIFLHRYTTHGAYLIAITKAPHRFDLDGAPAGDLTDEHRQAARAELERRRALHEARRVAENEARRADEQQAQRERAADEQARRDRAALLRAFETSTLTRANFCVLKRIAESELDALLAQARQEASERAQQAPAFVPRPPEPPRGPRGPRVPRGRPPVAGQ